MVSIITVKIGIAMTKIKIFPAISILDAIAPCPASFVICEPNSAIYAIPIIFKIVSTYIILTFAVIAILSSMRIISYI